jgi:cytochrome c peroxidase
MALRSAFRVARTAASVSVSRSASALAVASLSKASRGPSSSTMKAVIAAAAAAVAGVTLVTAEKDKAYYKKVYDDIADLLDDIDYDDGSYGPVLVRLAWHASGTYDKATKTGTCTTSPSLRLRTETHHTPLQVDQTLRQCDSIRKAPMERTRV